MFIKINDKETINLENIPHFEKDMAPIDGTETTIVTITIPFRGPVQLIGDNANKFEALVQEQAGYTVLSDVVL